MSFRNLILLRPSLLHVNISTNVTMTLRQLSLTSTFHPSVCPSIHLSVCFDIVPSYLAEGVHIKHYGYNKPLTLESKFQIIWTKFCLTTRNMNSFMTEDAFILFACFSTAKVMLKQSISLTTFFSCARVTKWLTSSLCIYTHVCLHFLNQWKEENECRKYFMINLHESMGMGRDRTHNP